jgi:hypothetical protein
VVMEIETGGRSPALTKRLRELETALADLQTEIKAKRAMMGTKSVQARLADLNKALDTGSAAVVNTALRELFSSVTVDYRTGDLDMRSHSGAVCRVSYQWVE